MSAPENAKPIGLDGFTDGEDNPISKSQMRKELRFKCQGCNYIGHVGQLLGIDPDIESTMWCPRCKSAGWEWI